MIRRDEVYKIGRIVKPHGLKGEVSFSFSDDIFDRTDSEYLICDMDGILVPFFMEEYRFRSDSAAIVKFEGIDSEEDARRLVGCDVYFPQKMAVEEGGDELSLYYFVGFEVFEYEGDRIGTIVAVDDNTENWLFEIEIGEGKTVLVPAHEEFIVDIDHEQKRMVMNLPDGLLELQA